MTKLIANMVGRNEESRYLKPVLERLKDQVDLILFTDDNSTDATSHIAYDNGAVVQQLQLDDPKDSVFSKDEYELRSKSWEMVDKYAKEGDWILAIDCDEMLYTPSDDHLQKVMAQRMFDVVNIVFCHMWNDKEYRTDKAWRPTNSSRLFRYKPGGTFKRSKLACGSEPTYVLDMIRRRKYLMKSGLYMKHLGYARDEDKQAKYDRYMKLDAGEFHNLDHIKSIMDPNPQLVEWRIE